MKYYAVIDTNVLVSAALKWHSVPGSIVELVFEGYIITILLKKLSTALMLWGFMWMRHLWILILQIPKIKFFMKL